MLELFHLYLKKEKMPSIKEKIERKFRPAPTKSGWQGATFCLQREVDPEKQEKALAKARSAFNRGNPVRLPRQ